MAEQLVPISTWLTLGRGSQRLHTCWIPFGDVPVEKGTLAILVGSHNLPSFDKIRQTYGQTDVDQDRTPGHFGTDPLAISEQFGGAWKTADFEAGDVIIIHHVYASYLHAKHVGPVASQL